ncbi:hypothetical protein MUP77_09125 [Candidatus Bathyarchaeota archaeon]|nr:hypothetical protein [Candidatus Bathyarchaeota archaeon]
MLIDDTSELLKDGEWHTIEAIAMELNQPLERILKVLSFCAEFRILAFDESGSKVRMDKGFRELFS